MVIYKFLKWFREFGWRHLVGLIFAVISLYPILYVVTNSFADFANLANSKLIPDGFTTNFIVSKNESDITLSAGTYSNDQLFYFYDEAENVVKKYDSTTNTLSTNTDYIARRGRASIDFKYRHNAGQDTRIDPSVSNIVDLYLLERSYDTRFRTWLKEGGTKPVSYTHLTLPTIYSV